MSPVSILNASEKLLTTAAKQRAYERAWRLRNNGGREKAAKWRAANPERVAEIRRAYRLRNLERLREEDRESQRKRRLGGDDPATILYLTIISTDPCVYCGTPSESTDHIDPVSRGGPNHWTNYTPACGSCNSAKKDKPLLMFLAQKAA